MKIENLVAIFKISKRERQSGIPIAISLSKRPALRNEASSTSGLFVVPITNTLEPLDPRSQFLFKVSYIGNSQNGEMQEKYI